MACKNQKCEKCGCDKPVQPKIPNTLPMAGAAPPPVVPQQVDQPGDGGGLWKFALGFAFGWLFMGC